MGVCVGVLYSLCECVCVCVSVCVCVCGIWGMRVRSVCRSCGAVVVDYRFFMWVFICFTSPVMS